MKKQTNNKNKSEINNKKGKLGKLEIVLNFITNGITPYFIIAVIIFGVYFQTLTYGITGLDDEIILKNANSLILKNNIFEAFFTDASLSHQGFEFYRPIQGLSFIIDAELGNSNHFFSHSSNLIIHIITCCLLFYLLTLFNNNKKISFFLTLIFSVHPLFNQAVIWLPSRGDLLVSLFSLISLIAYINFLNTKKYISFLINIITFFLSVFSKEIAILLPVIFLLYYYFKEKNIIRILNLNHILLIIAWCLIILLYLIMRTYNVNIVLKPGQFGLKAFIHNIPVIPEFISKFFIPFNLSVLPKFNIAAISIGTLTILGILFLEIKYKKIFGDYSFIFVVWFILFTITPLFYRHEQLNYSYDYLEHRAYMPLMGIIMLISGLKIYYRKLKIFIILLLSIFILFIGFTIVRSSIFKDPISFYSSAIDNGTTVVLAYYNRGVTKKELGDIKGAQDDYNRAIELKPDYIKAIYNLGIISKDLGDNKSAIKYYDRTIELKPDYAEAYNNRGIIKEIIGDTEGAKKDFIQAIKLKPNYFEAYNNRGLLQNKLGNIDDAIKDYNKAIEINPNYEDAFLNRGEIYLKLNNFTSATSDFKKALELKHDYDKALNSMGVLFAMQGNIKEATKYFEKAIQINPNYLDVIKNLGFAKLNIGDKQGACQIWRKGAALGNNECKVLLEKFCK